MKKKLMLMYAVCAAIIIVGSLLWFIFTLRTDSFVGKTESLHRFKAFTQQTADALQKMHPEMSQQLYDTIEQLCRNNRNHIHAVLIRRGTDTLFIWPEHTDVFSYSDTGTVHLDHLPLFLTAAKTVIPAMERSEAVTIHAALQTVSMQTVFRRGQTVFFITLTLSIITLIVLICSYIDFVAADFDSVTHAKTGGGTNLIPDEEELDEEDKHLQIPPLSADPAAEETAYEEVADEPISQPQSLSEQIESLNRLHIYEDSDDGSAEPILQNQSDEAAPSTAPKEKAGEAAIPATLPQYGSFGTDQHDVCKPYGEIREEAAEGDRADPIPVDGSSGMQQSVHRTPIDAQRSVDRAKLIEELDKAISETSMAEEDLALLFIRLPGISQNANILESIKATLDRISKLFFFDDDTIGLIIYYASLDNAMQMAAKLYEDIHTMFSAGQNTHLALGIGLTTRAGRLIPAYRMIDEAAAAINKTGEEDSDPIIAFRVNPDKYRECISKM